MKGVERGQLQRRLYRRRTDGALKTAAEARGVQRNQQDIPEALKNIIKAQAKQQKDYATKRSKMNNPKSHPKKTCGQTNRDQTPGLCQS